MSGPKKDSVETMKRARVDLVSITTRMHNFSLKIDYINNVVTNCFPATLQQPRESLLWDILNGCEVKPPSKAAGFIGLFTAVVKLSIIHITFR